MDVTHPTRCLTTRYAKPIVRAMTTNNIIRLPDWAERKIVGDAHEARVREEFEKRGYIVAPWGQGLLCEPIRRLLSRTKCELRWEPDLYVSDERDLFMVDCKARMSPHTRRHSISREAHVEQLKLASRRRQSLLYVFDDLTVMDVYEVAARAPRARLKLGPTGAYYLIDPELTHPFDTVFGERWPWVEDPGMRLGPAA